MKSLFFFLAGLCFSLVCCAQNIKVSQNTIRDKNKLVVSLINDKLTVTDKDQPVPIVNINTLDSLIKKLPNTEALNIHFQSENADPEKIQAITVILNKCNCHVTAQHKAFNKISKTNK